MTTVIQTPFRPLLALTLLVGAAVLPSAGADHLPPAPACVSPVGKDVVLVLDRSASMLADNKIGVAKAAASLLLAELDRTRDQSALVAFSSGFSLEKGLSKQHMVAQHATLSTQAKVNALVADGATALGGAIRMARFELDNGLPNPSTPPYYSGNARAGVPHAMVVLSDGDQTMHWADPLYEASYAKRVSGITVFSVALGVDISESGLSVMENISSSPDHYFRVVNPADLGTAFRQIAKRLNDTAPPTVAITRPSPTSHRLFEDDADKGASPIPGASAASGLLQARAIAGDDCLVDRVAWEIDVHERGALLRTDDLGSVHAATSGTYRATIDCDALPAGRHVLRATAYDWLGNSAVDERAIWCLRPVVDARATALHARATNPAEPVVESEGAALPTPTGGADAFALHAERRASPTPVDLSALYDEVAGGVTAGSASGRAQHLAARALSREANATFAALGLRLDAIETSARVALDAEPGRPIALSTAGSFAPTRVATGSPALDALIAAATDAGCLAPVVAGGVEIESCPGKVATGVGFEVRFGETIRVAGLGFEEITVNGVHVLVDRPEGRAEVILAQSYAGASWLGLDALRGPARSLALASDAGTHADASDDWTAPLPLAPGLYGARVEDAGDVDAYGIAAAPGKKVHVAIVASNEAAVTLHGGAPAPGAPAEVAPFVTGAPARASATTALPAFTIELLDPAGVVRDAKSVTPGGASAVELNVDAAGTWVARVAAPSGRAGEYTLAVTVSDAPMTQANDALRGSDAGSTCTDSLLVGPGAHVGTIEHGDASDWYRFQLHEGQILALTLRPGDTADAADMDVRFYDPACNLLADPAPLVGAGVAKGSPEVVLYTVPPGASGLYRAEVAYVNGLGTYEIAIVTSVAAVPL